METWNSVTKLKSDIRVENSDLHLQRTLHWEAVFAVGVCLKGQRRDPLSKGYELVAQNCLAEWKRVAGGWSRPLKTPRLVLL